MTMKITDIEARKAVNTIIQYCREADDCDTCAIKGSCQLIWKNIATPSEMPKYDLQPKLESGTNCVESDADPLLHASYVDHDGNVVFVD